MPMTADEFQTAIEQLAFKLMKTDAKYCPQCGCEIVHSTPEAKQVFAYNHARVCMAEKIKNTKNADVSA